MEPAEAGLIQYEGSNNANPLRASISVAHCRIPVVAYRVSAGKHDPGGLDTMRRNPAKQAQAKAQSVLFVQMIVDFAEAEVLGDRTGNRAEIARGQHLDR